MTWDTLYEIYLLHQIVKLKVVSGATVVISKLEFEESNQFLHDC